MLDLTSLSLKQSQYIEDLFEKCYNDCHKAAKVCVDKAEYAGKAKALLTAKLSASDRGLWEHCSKGEPTDVVDEIVDGLVDECYENTVRPVEDAALRTYKLEDYKQDLIEELAMLSKDAYFDVFSDFVSSIAVKVADEQLAKTPQPPLPKTEVPVTAEARIKLDDNKVIKTKLGEYSIAELRGLANIFHGGQWSPLYAFSSSGYITPGLANEAEKAIFEIPAEDDEEEDHSDEYPDQEDYEDMLNAIASLEKFLPEEVEAKILIPVTAIDMSEAEKSVDALWGGGTLTAQARTALARAYRSAFSVGRDQVTDGIFDYKSPAYRDLKVRWDKNPNVKKPEFLKKLISGDEETVYDVIRATHGFNTDLSYDVYEKHFMGSELHPEEYEALPGDLLELGVKDDISELDEEVSGLIRTAYSDGIESMIIEDASETLASWAEDDLKHIETEASVDVSQTLREINLEAETAAESIKGLTAQYKAILAEKGLDSSATAHRTKEQLLEKLSRLEQIVKQTTNEIVGQAGAKPDLEQIEILRKIAKDGTSDKWNKISELWFGILGEPVPDSPTSTTDEINQKNAQKILNHFKIGPGFVKASSTSQLIKDVVEGYIDNFGKEKVKSLKELVTIIQNHGLNGAWGDEVKDLMQYDNHFLESAAKAVWKKLS